MYPRIFLANPEELKDRLCSIKGGLGFISFFFFSRGGRGLGLRVCKILNKAIQEWHPDYSRHTQHPEHQKTHT